MPRFHFSIVGDAHGLDRHVFDLPSIAAARCEAAKTMGEILCDSSDITWDQLEWTMTVADDTGLTLFTLMVVGSDAPALRRERTPRVSAMSA